VIALSHQQGSLLRKTGVTLVAWAVVGATAFPLFWMLSSSFKPQAELVAVPPRWLPSQFSVASYSRVFTQTDFGLWFMNSTIVAVVTMCLVVTVGLLGAYSLTRFHFRGKNALALAVLFTYFFPPVLMLIPLFLILSYARLTDTYFSLIVANATFTLPFALWLLRSYLHAIPAQLEEAAMVDGAARLRAFVDVVIPQALPGIITTAIFTFIHTWNDYLFALVFISSSVRATLPLGIAGFANSLTVDWGALMACSVAVTLPALAFFAVLQKQLVTGAGAGAVKG